MKRIVTRSAVLILLLGTGCSSIGPGTIPRDRLDYSDSLAESWKSQVLKNLVKMRYLDTPIFLDVSQVVSGYTFETGASVSGQLAPPGRGDTFVGVGGHGTFTDRPTITYTPLTGDKFLRAILDPVPPRTIFYLLQSGYAADFVLGTGVESLNGVRNRSFQAGRVRRADPAFVRTIELLQQIQYAGGIGIAVEGGTNKDQACMFFRQDGVAEEVVAQIQEVKELLKLPPEEQRFRLVYSPVRGAAQELAVGSRSLLQMLNALATFVEVPKEDVEQRRTPAMPDASAWTEPPLSVRCASKKPDDAFVVVQYRRHWFWVDDRDCRSKRTLSAILFLLTLTDNGAGDRLPMLTIPAG
jgi:hypothetical protein